MTSISLQGTTRETLREMFRQYGVPTAQRDAITANMLEDTELTMYSLMQAITQAANSSDLSPAQVTQLMEIGGDIPFAAQNGVCNQDHPCGRLLGHNH
jgi:hypothetical protein